MVSHYIVYVVSHFRCCLLQVVTGYVHLVQLRWISKLAEQLRRDVVKSLPVNFISRRRMLEESWKNSCDFFKLLEQLEASGIGVIVFGEHCTAKKGIVKPMQRVNNFDKLHITATWFSFKMYQFPKLVLLFYLLVPPRDS